MSEEAGTSITLGRNEIDVFFSEVESAIQYYCAVVRPVNTDQMVCNFAAYVVTKLDIAGRSLALDELLNSAAKDGEYCKTMHLVDMFV